jgi:hypothetical protein
VFGFPTIFMVKEGGIEEAADPFQTLRKAVPAKPPKKHNTPSCRIRRILNTFGSAETGKTPPRGTLKAYPVFPALPVQWISRMKE